MAHERRAVTWDEFSPVKTAIETHIASDDVKWKASDKIATTVDRLEEAILRMETVFKTTLVNLTWIIPLAGLIAGISSSLTKEGIRAVSNMHTQIVQTDGVN